VKSFRDFITPFTTIILKILGTSTILNQIDLSWFIFCTVKKGDASLTMIIVLI